MFYQNTNGAIHNYMMVKSDNVTPPPLPCPALVTLRNNRRQDLFPTPLTVSSGINEI